MAKIEDLAAARERLDHDIAQQIQIRAGELPRMMKEAESALIEGDSGIFQRGGQLVRIVQLQHETVAQGLKRPAGSTLIVPVSKDYLPTALSTHAKWARWDVRNREWFPANPPDSVARGILANVGAWEFPVLTGLVAAPTLRTDGTLMTACGYDTGSGLFGVFDPAEFPTINPTPTREDALVAFATLKALFEECAFEGGANSPHACVAVAATITAAIRHALPMAPAFGISAAKAGSGKTTAARAIAQVCTGREPPVLALSEDETELRKTLLAVLIAGDACVLIDNVAKPVDSAALCAILTSITYSDRVLGGNTRVIVPTSSTWLMTGNHLEFVGDLTTRVVLSVLDPQMERPEARSFQRDLQAYIAVHRGELLAAALTIPLAYIAANFPPLDENRSRYPQWDKFVRFPLLWIDAPDPLDTQDALRGTDPVREGLLAVLRTWRSTFAEKQQTVATVIEAASATGFSENVPLKDALMEVAGNRDGTINNRKLGRYLVRNARRIEDGMRVELCGEEPLTHRIRYRVAGVTGVSGVSFSPLKAVGRQI